MTSRQNSASTVDLEPALLDLDAVTRAEAAANSRRVADEQARGVRAKQAAEVEARFGRAGIPRRYAEFTFATFPVERVMAPDAHASAAAVATTCAAYAANWPAMAAHGTNVTLVGGIGTGKTGLACAIANHVMRAFDATALFISAYGAVRHQRDTWRVRGKTETDALRELVTPDLLILDEVGAQLGTDSEQLMLFEVLNGRYAERRPTVLLSNLPVAGAPCLRDYLGERIWSRYSDDGSFVLACDWPSLRGARRSGHDG